MKDIFESLLPWLEEHRPFALATVTQTWGSAPRAVGSAMAITSDMQVIGSVSGGCIEGEVIEKAVQVLETGLPALLNFGVSDETAWSVGLTCGGKVSVFLEKYIAFSTNPTERQIWKKLKTAISEDKPVILLTRLEAEKHGHLLVFPDGSQVGNWQDLNQQANSQALLHYEDRTSGQVNIEDEAIFVQIFPQKDCLIIIGAVHIAIPLIDFAKKLDFKVVVIDPRQVFAAVERFSTPPDYLISQWPDEALQDFDLNGDTYVALLTHDPKIDDDALRVLLRSDVSYIGALGSRKTHAKRCKRLSEFGFTHEEISRIHGPAGLDIQAQTPTEIALSIISQIIQIKRGAAQVKEASP